MAGYKKTKKLPPEVAAYIAGLIDGEGTVTLSRRHANENRQLVISIANTERGLLEQHRSHSRLSMVRIHPARPRLAVSCKTSDVESACPFRVQRETCHEDQQL